MLPLSMVAVIMSAVMFNVVMPFCILIAFFNDNFSTGFGATSFDGFHYDECHYAKCHYAKCHYAECH